MAFCRGLIVPKVGHFQTDLGIALRRLTPAQAHPLLRLAMLRFYDQNGTWKGQIFEGDY